MSQMNNNNTATSNFQIAGNMNINCDVIKQEIPEPEIPDLSETQILENQMKDYMEKYQKKVQGKKDAFQQKQEINSKKIEELQHKIDLDQSNIDLQKGNLVKLQEEVNRLMKEVEQGELEFQNYQNQNKKEEEKNTKDEVDNRNNQLINNDLMTRCQLIEQICIVQKRIGDQPRHCYFNNISNSCMR